MSALLLLIGGGIIASELSALADAQRELDASVAALAEANAQEVRLSQSLRRLDELRFTTSVDELDALRERERARVGTDGSTSGGALPDSVSDAVLAGFPVRRTLLSIDGAMQTRRDELARLSERFRTILEPQLSALAVALDAQLIALSDSQDGAPDDGSPSRSLAGSIDLQTLLTELAFRTNAFIDNARQLSYNPAVDGRSIDAAPSAYALQSITAILVTLDDVALRTELARTARQLRDAVLGPSGVYSLLALRATGAERLAATSEQQATLIARLSSDIQAGVADTRQAAADANARATAARKRAWSVSLWSTLATLSLIGLIAFLVVERQIARRLSRLTRAVLAVADGDTSAAVGVSGQDEIGRMAAAVGVFKRNASQLAQSNLELEEFAYAASHDMRSPLRAIENLAQWTLEDSREQLDDEGVRNLELILERTNRLDALLRDLLDYARAGHVMPEPEPVDARELIAELNGLLDLQGRFELSLTGDEVQLNTALTPLRQILLNLIGNAVKHHDRANGSVTVRIRRLAADSVEVAVIDDGPGIDPDYQQRIFKLFETLRSRDEVEGSGLGLALVRKLVSRFGGTIRVESDPSRTRGTVLAFDWPG